MQSDIEYVKMIAELAEMANKWNEIVDKYNGDGAHYIRAHTSPYTGLISRFSIGYYVED